jgi:SAM-dependent methyltransferase
MSEHRPQPLPEVIEFYERYGEESRLQQGVFQLEFERTKAILTAVLPPPPARIVDVGGAAGVYSFWLAAQGYEVHLVDGSPRLVSEARRRNAEAASKLASIELADARQLPHADASADVVLVMGPLYHLPAAADRLAALRDAARVLAPSGLLAAAGISRYASTLDGLARFRGTDEMFLRMRDRDLRDGQHRNPTGQLEYFTTAYLHHPDELRDELIAAGFRGVDVYGVEGPGWMLAEFDRRWQDAALRRDLLHVAAALEREETVLGVSAHLLAVGRKAV